MRPPLIESGQFNADGSLANSHTHGGILGMGRRVSQPSQLNALDNYVKELFVAVDAKRAGTVTWEGFVNFLVENAMRDSKYRMRGGRRHRHGQAHSYLYSGASFGQTPDEVRDVYTGLYYFDDWNRIVGVTKRRARVCECAEIGTDPVVVKTLDHPGWVLAAEYADAPGLGPKVLLTACADLHVRAWFAGTGQFDHMALLKEMHLPQSVQSMCWDARRGILFLGDRAGELRIMGLGTPHGGWGVRVDLEKELRVLSAQEGTGVTLAQSAKSVRSLPMFHDAGAPITAIAMLGNDHIVTAGLDAKIFNYRPDLERA
eukprot:gene38108-28149_t